ncbi:unnamed protein product [Tilletia caries]|nr:unnamed protein product [Tilletia caries]
MAPSFVSNSLPDANELLGMTIQTLIQLAQKTSPSEAVIDCARIIKAAQKSPLDNIIPNIGNVAYANKVQRPIKTATAPATTVILALGHPTPVTRPRTSKITIIITNVRSSDLGLVRLLPPYHSFPSSRPHCNTTGSMQLWLLSSISPYHRPANAYERGCSGVLGQMNDGCSGRTAFSCG